MSEATALRARPRPVLAALGQQVPALLAVVTPPAVLAAVTGQGAMALSLLPQVIALSAIIWALRDYSFPRDLRQIEALAAFASLFLLAGALVVPPFVVLGMTPLNAVFEAVSAITSTGLSVATGTEDWPVAAHLLRGWVQWCGGFAIAFAGLAIFTGSPGASLALAGSSVAARDNLSSLRSQARNVLLSYAALSGVAVVACLLVIADPWEAVAIALAAVSTGGFTPRADSLSSYGPLAQGVVIGICIAAALSLIFYVQVLRDGLSAALAKTHVTAGLALMAFGTAVFVTLDLVTTSADASELYRGALNFLSGFTTAGFSVGEVTTNVALLPLILIAMVIGGDLGSTGGGVKVGRFVVLCRAVRLIFVRVTVPASAVTYLRDRSVLVTADRMIAVAALLSLYIATAMLAWIVFLISGAAPLPALFEVISALSTVGLSQGLTGPDLAAHLKGVLIVTMLLGRLEFVALIVLLLPQTWLKRG